MHFTCHSQTATVQNTAKRYRTTEPVKCLDTQLSISIHHEKVCPNFCTVVALFGDTVCPAASSARFHGNSVSGNGNRTLNLHFLHNLYLLCLQIITLSHSSLSQKHLSLSYVSHFYPPFLFLSLPHQSSPSLSLCFSLCVSLNAKG